MAARHREQLAILAGFPTRGPCPSSASPPSIASPVFQVDGATVEMSVKVQGVRDEEGRYHMEVGATCPQLTEQLNRRLAAHAAAGPGEDGGDGEADAGSCGGSRATAARSEGAAGARASSNMDGPLDVQLYIHALLKISRLLLDAC